MGLNHTLFSPTALLHSSEHEQTCLHVSVVWCGCVHVCSSMCVHAHVRTLYLATMSIRMHYDSCCALWHGLPSLLGCPTAVAHRSVSKPGGVCLCAGLC